METVAHSHPTADDEEAYGYEQSISLKALDEAVGEAFLGEELDFERWMILLHGAADDTDLPDSTPSLSDVPAHVTRQIARGGIRTSSG